MADMIFMPYSPEIYNSKLGPGSVHVSVQV
jgi:hypothetical protein